MALNIQDLDVVDNNNQDNWPEGTMLVNQVNDAGRVDEGLKARWFADWNGSKSFAGTASAYTFSSNTQPTAYYAGFRVRGVVTTTNDGALTLNVDALGANSVKLPNGGDPEAGDFPAGMVASFTHDGGSTWIAENPDQTQKQVKLNVQVFDASGTFDKTTIGDAAGVYVKVKAAGGAGGGVTSTTASTYAAGSGGGEGGFGEGWIDAADLLASETVTVAPVTAGTTGQGAQGQNSSFGAHISAVGGLGGNTGSVASPNIATTPSVNGGTATLASTAAGKALRGSASTLGILSGIYSQGGTGGGQGSGRGGFNAASGEAGSAGVDGGGGGGAGSGPSQAGFNGGDGGAGYVLVYWYTYV